MNGNRAVVRARKPKASQTVALNISLTPTLYSTLNQIIVAKGFRGPVDYFSSRIRLDGGLTLRVDEQAA